MNIVTTLKQKTGYIVTSAALVLGVIAPGLVSVYVSAATVTTRSITLSNASITSTNVTYKVDFAVPAAGTAAGAFAVEFCSNSADTDTACVAPGGFTAAGADTTSAGFTKETATNANKFIMSGTIDPSDVVSAEVTGITNPSAAGPLYARIATFADATAANTGTAILDKGSVVIGITNTIGVSGAVLETMTFCVTKVVIEEDCANANAGPSLPTLELGETVGSTKALSAGAVSTGILYTQLSTNAASGAVINLKSATDCGGLKRVGAAVCDIAPALNDGVSNGVAKFGVRAAASTSTSGVATASGILQPVTGSNYNPTTYVFNYVDTNSSGVTSTFGDPFLDTDGKPVNNQNVQLTFGASVSNNTPAGNYSTSLSLIATGKF